jgi:hypothetical protein
LPCANRNDYSRAIIENNCLRKSTDATKRLSDQRLGELYGLDPELKLFRVLRRLWAKDETGQPLLALLSALARDPLLAASAEPITQLEVGADYLREPLRAGVQLVVGERLNDDTLDKVVRNVASSWTQSGHLEGRALKRRRRVVPTTASLTFALYLAYQVGFRGYELFTNGWVRVLDCSPTEGHHLALEAKRLGLIDMRISADVVEISFRQLEQPL